MKQQISCFSSLCAPDLNFQLNEILEERGKTLVLRIRKMRETLHTHDSLADVLGKNSES